MKTIFIITICFCINIVCKAQNKLDTTSFNNQLRQLNILLKEKRSETHLEKIPNAITKNFGFDTLKNNTQNFYLLKSKLDGIIALAPTQPNIDNMLVQGIMKNLFLLPRIK